MNRCPDCGAGPERDPEGDLGPSCSCVVDAGALAAALAGQDDMVFRLSGAALDLDALGLDFARDRVEAALDDLRALRANTSRVLRAVRGES